MMRALAIILARGGSKGVPGKNTREVGGKPCIAWTIEQAQRARRVGRVLVSTDDTRAKAISEELGAEAIERPAELAGDAARVDDAARHALEVSGHEGLVVILYANVPVRPEWLIDEALELLESSGCDSVQSYAPVGKHHPWWTARLGEGGAVSPWEGEVLNHGVYRRQDLPPAFVPDGGVIALSARALRLEIPGATSGPHAFFGVDRRGVRTGEGEVIDIDSEIDVLVADAVLRRKMA
ncbi:MAG: acylneuraminate cytidylyltransferase family protein [Phycisphaerales bacterium]|nr:acylneuraminate cytidylyltransferase family protein [Phycisphaerales bacterium]